MGDNSEKKDDSACAEEIALVKELQRGRGWELFLARVRRMATRLYERRLREVCNCEVDDLLSELTLFLTADNNRQLNRLADNMISACKGFSSAGLLISLKGVYKNLELRNKGVPTISSDRGQDDGDGQSHARDLPDLPANEKDHNRATDKITSRLEAVARITRMLWDKSHLGFLTFYLCKFKNQSIAYAAALLGFESGNAVSKRMQNSLAGLLKDSRATEALRANFPGMMRRYCADGEDDASRLDAWLRHDLGIAFRFETGKNGSRRFVFVEFPFDCSHPADRCLLVECTDGEGRRFAQAVELRWRDLRCPLTDGVGEINLLAFQTSLRAKESPTERVLLMLPDGRELAGYPQIDCSDVRRRITLDETCLNPATGGAAPGELARRLLSWGRGLTYLFDNRQDLTRYGAPPDRDYSHLRPTAGEAWVLFASDVPGEKGLVLPLEWRRDVCALADPHSALLPDPLVRLARRIGAAVELELDRASGGRRSRDIQWGLHPSARFFHDRVDFSHVSLFGRDDVSVASAGLTLLAALVQAMNEDYQSPVPVFASAKITFGARPDLAAVGHLAQKLGLAADWRAESFLVADEQAATAERIAKAGGFPLQVVPVRAGGLLRMGEAAACHFLRALKVEKSEALGRVDDADVKMRRVRLETVLRSAVNAQWDKTEGTERGRLTALVGRPGSGKSVLMGDVAERFRSQGHFVVSHACHLADGDSAERFVRHVAWQFARQYDPFARLVLRALRGMRIARPLTDAELADAYRRLVVEPLRQCGISGRRNYLLVDGIGKDRSWRIARLLSRPEFALPKKVSVLVSLRPLEPLMTEMRAAAHTVIDLDSEPYAAWCRKDIELYIDTAIQNRASIRSRCLGAYNDDGGLIDERKMRDQIAGRSRSFLYAKYVLRGIESGRYDFSRLERDLPSDLSAYYTAAFREMFPTERHYAKVRPLLRVLTGEKSRLSIEEAKSLIATSGATETLARMIQMMRGYCLIASDGSTLALSESSLCDWLTSVSNPDFAV